jgi:hypothetical protein
MLLLPVLAVPHGRTVTTVLSGSSPTERLFAAATKTDVEQHYVGFLVSDVAKNRRRPMTNKAFIKA